MKKRGDVSAWKKYGTPLDLIDNVLRYQYWPSEEKVAPLHSILAEIFLCIPAAAIGNESLNSIAGHLSHKQRASTTPTTLEFLTLAKIIYQNEFKKSKRLEELEAAAQLSGWLDWDEVDKALGNENDSE